MKKDKFKIKLDRKEMLKLRDLLLDDLGYMKTTRQDDSKEGRRGVKMLNKLHKALDIPLIKV